MDLRQRLTDPSLVTTSCYIGGAWCGEGQDAVLDPATGDLLGMVPRFEGKEAIEAIEAAAAALLPWSAMTGKERGGILRAWLNLILQSRNDLAAILTAEQGKPLREAEGEIDYAASYVEFYAEEAKRIHGEILSNPRRDARILVLRQPIGVVAAITPWNFPAAMITRKVAPALAAGCTVVLKPAPDAPLTALALAQLSERAGIPSGVLNVITGDAVAIGEAFTSHPAVRVLGFTGSTGVGKLLASRCAVTLKRVALELGGNAPFIVFEDANLEEAVKGALIAKFRNTGQTCVCVNRFYVHENVQEEFITLLHAAIMTLRPGNGFDPASTQGPLINTAAVEKTQLHLADAVDKGARIVCGGALSSLGGTFFQPTLLRDVTAGMLIAREETFGPVAAVTSFTEEAQVLRMANDTPSGLASYLYTQNLARAVRVSEALQYGMVGINSGVISTELAPFGGIKESGNSREGSHHGIEEFVEKKYILLGGL
jgi:succinate-semialdehyde dehydrogenase/glutarate-semialdehyde dehydrogenase